MTAPVRRKAFIFLLTRLFISQMKRLTQKEAQAKAVMAL
jgi:hypothetical protein